MSRSAEEIVAAGRALIGAPFRPQGRSAETGLDCIGLAAGALGVTGVPHDYSLRGGSEARLAEGLAAAGLRPVKRARPGDLMVMAAGAGQLHLGLFTGEGIVHADAGLGRVVERPGEPPWPTLSIWRL